MKKPVSYLQYDSRWAEIDYSAKGESTTIRKAGCGPTSAAMVIATLKDKTVTPATTAKWSLQHGYKACRQGTYYSYFVPQMKVYGIKCTQLNSANMYKAVTDKATTFRATVKKALQEGNWIIACMGKGTWTSSGHYVLAYGISGGKILINDPASVKTERTHGNPTTFLNEIKYAWVIEVTEEKEEEDMTEAQTKALIEKYLDVRKDIKDCPEFGDELTDLKNRGVLKGDGTSEVNLPYSCIRTLVLMKRQLEAEK